MAIILSTAVAQNDVMINVTGKVLSAKDSSEISTSILYEKLPYYDDMGMATANGSGDFSFYLIKDVTYNISIRKPRYKVLNQEVKVNDQNSILNFYLELDKEEETFQLRSLIFARGSDLLQKDSYGDRLADRKTKDQR